MIFGVNWVFPKSVRETFLSWQGSFVGKRHKKAWMKAPLTCFGLFGMKGTTLLLMIESFQLKG